ncbi:MAG TPA: hypothetical protein VGH33_25940, partial [Isosphaeraceae bacterium]
GFHFLPDDGSPPIPIDGPAEIALGGKGPSAKAGVPPVQVVLGWDQRVSGQLVGLDETTIRLVDGPGGRPVNVERPGALGLRQRPGEAIVLIDGFESIDPTRWSLVGDPKVEPEPRLAGERSLRLGADGSAITARLAEPVSQGRLELAYHDTDEVVAGASWFVDLLFRGEGGPETVRAVLGWSEESLGVSSTGGPVLAVQRLARKPGWHRLEVRFGHDSSELSVDGDSLARGKGTTGPLVEVRIGTSLAPERPAAKVAAHVDDFRLVRIASVVTSAETDPGQDEARLVEGDQVFGSIPGADARGVTMVVLGSRIPLPWSQVAALQFRRAPRPSREVEGLLCRIEWRSAPGDDPRDLDQAEGALVRADAEAFTLETPYAGTLVVPRDRLRKLVVEAIGRRLVIDPTAHHMGDEVTTRGHEMLDPPQPEGGQLERAFPLERPPSAGQSAQLVMDVVQVVGEAQGLEFSNLIRAGELRTKVSINGKEFDYINRHISSRNEKPERIRLPIPAGLLKAGENKLKIIQTGTSKDPNYLDDLGIVGIALEVTKGAEKP